MRSNTLHGVYSLRGCNGQDLTMYLTDSNKFKVRKSESLSSQNMNHSLRVVLKKILSFKMFSDEFEVLLQQKTNICFYK